MWAEVARYLQRFLPRDGTLLDLGAGYCDFIRSIEAREKHAVDRNPQVREFAGPGVVVHVGSAAEVALPEARFDAVFASNFLEHFEDAELEKIVAAVRRVLKPEGLFVVIQPNYRYAVREYFDDYTHKKVFSHVSLCDFLEAQGFQVRLCRPRFLPFSFRSVRMPAPRWLVWLYLRSPLKPLAKQMLVVAQKGASRNGLANRP